MDGTDVYVTNKPCSTCFKLLIGAGVSRIFYKEGYPDEFTDKLIANVKYVKNYEESIKLYVLSSTHGSFDFRR